MDASTENHSNLPNGHHINNVNSNYEKDTTITDIKIDEKQKTAADMKEIEANEQDFSYGCFGTKPKWLQTLNKAGWLLFFMCFANIFQSMVVNGLIGTILSSIETRFGFTSGQSSWIVSSYDVSTIPMLILISYFGSSSHRARWTGVGLVVICLGSVIMTLPHFVTDEYRPIGSSNDAELCRARGNDTTLCDEQGQGQSSGEFLAIFIIGRLFYGIGAVPLYTICVTFLDDCVSKETFSLYVAIFYASGVLGPALGFMVGGYLLSFFTDFPTVDAQEELGLTDTDPLWVGAWWPGYLAGAVGLIFIGIPMLGYNRDLPGAAEVRANKTSEAYTANGEEEEEMGVNEIKVSWRELPAYFKALFTNPTYVFLTLFVCGDSLLMGGFTAFGPKYVELQFSISAAFAGILFGIVVVPGGAGGTVFGGFLVKKLKLTCSQIMKYEAVFTVLILLTSFMFFIVCDPISFAGVNSGYNTSISDFQEGDFTATCNMDCLCDDYVTFTPVCGDNNVQYFSPCHAGCNSSNEGKTEYYNCTCLEFGTVKTDPCDSSCELIPLFMVLFFIAMFLLFACSSMNITATVRCVPASQRSLAIGIQWILLRLLGTIPGPISFGTAFDGACSLWQTTCDGSQGQCLFYDLRNLSLNIYLIAGCVKIATLIFIILAWKLYKPPSSKETEIKQNGDLNQNGDITKGVHGAINQNGIIQNGINQNGVNQNTITESGGIVSPVFESDENFQTDIVQNGNIFNGQDSKNSGVLLSTEL